MEELHQQRVNQMINSTRGGAQILKNEEEDARLLDRCEGKREAWAKHWQCDESVQQVEDKPCTM